MPAFIVVITKNINAVTTKIEEIAEENRYRLSSDVWLIDYDGTTRALAEKVGIRGNPYVGTGIVFPFSNYSGRAAADVWEWLGLHLKREEI
jgi:hypothetical protein